MARDFWSDIDESDGEYEPPKFELLPEGERVQANILKAEWKTVEDFKTKEDDRIISILIEVESGEYKGRNLFGSLKVYNPDSKRAERDKTMLAAIDKNAGGKLRALGREPDDDDLQKYLVNKSMVFVVGLMENGGKDGKGMNYLQGVSSGKSKSSQPAQKREEVQQSSKAQSKSRAVDLDEDMDLPF